MPSPSCPWCAAPSDRPTGAYMPLVVRGLVCRPCGRPTLYCECPKAGAPIDTWYGETSPTLARAMDGDR